MLTFAVLARPKTEKALAQVCKEGEVDMISLDMADRLPFNLKFTTVNLAVQRGIYFEIQYASALKDSHSRRNLISNVM